ncbi:MAG: AI-2E family transporter [Ruminococcaceae bacterium]|nr:AI-2E family transporter [Oscillospiraceae bacterium]
MDKDNREFDREREPEINLKDFKKKESALFISAVKLVVIGILLYVSLNHLELIWRGIIYIYILLRPLLFGSLLAMVFNTLMSAIDKLITFICIKIRVKIRRRGVEISSLVLSLVLAALLIYIIVDSIVPQLITSITDIVAKIQNNLIPEIYLLLEKIEARGVDTSAIEDWLAAININELIKQFSGEVVNILNTVVSGASTVVTGTFTALTSIIFAVYVLANKRSLSRQGKKLAYAYLKKSFVDRALEICRLTVHTFSNFISGQCLDAVILGIMCFIAMTIFGFPYALAISSMIILTAIIPYVGAFIGGAFGVLLLIIDDPMRAVWFVVLFIVVQQIDNHLVYPRVVGGSVGLPAIWTFAAVIVGGSLLGVFGMLLFIPLFSVLYTLLKNTVHNRLEKRGIVVEDLPYDHGDQAEKKDSLLERIWNKIATIFKKIFSSLKKKK